MDEHQERKEGDKTTLARKMLELAAAGHERAEELERLAVAFEGAAGSFYASPQTMDVKTFMGHWARARRVWCECSGEPLL